MLLQKTFIEDVLTGVSKKNTGQLPQYYIENNHEGIVTKQMFREVQAEIDTRSDGVSPMPAAIVSRQLTNANDTKAAITANMPYPNDWSAETVAALISGLLGTSTAENKSFGDASIDSNTEQNFAVIHRQSRKKNCIRLF